MTHKVYTEEELIGIAEKRIKVKRDLYSHVAAYIIVNAFLFFINWYTYFGYQWYLWVLAGWGIGLFMHIIETIQELNFNYNTNAVNKELEKIKKYIKDDNIDKE